MKGHNAVTVALLLALVAAGGRTAAPAHVRVPEHNMAAAPPAVFYDLAVDAMTTRPPPPTPAASASPCNINMIDCSIECCQAAPAE